jgi:hypothetical protein
MSAPPSTPGVPFGKYVIRTRLGRGGMGEVFLADQLGPLGPVRPVALKRLLPKHTDDPHVVRMFLEEMAVAAQLSHPNIAVTYDFGEVEGVYFLAMEYVDGLALDRLLAERGPLPLDAVVTLGQHVASALQHAHERVAAGAPSPVVHQDVTPHNILVSRSGDAKLLDFGIARTEAAALGQRVHAKVRYAAPEQLRRAPPDRRFDVWALGVTLYEALSGRTPFPQADLPSRLRAQEGAHFVPVDELVPSAKPLAEVVHRALAPRPQDRFQSAAALADALAEACPVPTAQGRAALGAAVAATSAAPASLDGGEITATGVPAPAPPRTATRSEDVAPTRIWAPAPAPPRPRSGVWLAVAGGLVLGGLGVVVARVAAAPDPAPTVVLRTAAPAAPGAGAAPLAEADRRAAPPPGPDALAPEAPGPGLGAPADVGAGPGTPAPPTDGAPPAEAPPPLEPDRAGSPAAAPRSPRRAPRRPAAGAGAGVAAASPSASAPSGGPLATGLGLVSIRTIPWARVSVDGRPLGEGVIAQRPLPAGAHLLRLVRGDGLGGPREVPITIVAGATTRVFVDFDRDEVRVTR